MTSLILGGFRFPRRQLWRDAPIDRTEGHLAGIVLIPGTKLGVVLRTINRTGQNWSQCSTQRFGMSYTGIRSGCKGFGHHVEDSRLMCKESKTSFRDNPSHATFYSTTGCH